MRGVFAADTHGVLTRATLLERGASENGGGFFFDSQQRYTGFAVPHRAITGKCFSAADVAELSRKDEAQRHLDVPDDPPSP
jgi:hypothetical protein